MGIELGRMEKKYVIEIVSVLKVLGLDSADI